MALPFVSSETSSWLLYILTDSALPTGGFVASSGLEAACQAGLLTRATLPAFVASSAHSYAAQTSCFVQAAWDAFANKDPLARMTDCDAICEAVMVTNAVARRASVAQGVAIITLYLKCFSDKQDHYNEVLTQFKKAIRTEGTSGHFAICFGLVCHCLGVDRDNTLHLWLYLFTRTLYSSAVRLNLVGPYEAQRMLFESRHAIETITDQTKGLTMDDCCQTNPLLDVCQGMHDRLYSRLFNS